jgi:hypothetical protein
MKAVGYRKSLPIEDADSLIDFETAKPEPKGRDVSAPPRPRARPKSWAMTPPASSMPWGPT